MKLKGLSLIQYLIFTLLCVGFIGCKDKKEKATLPPPVKVTVMEVGEGGSSGQREYSATVSSAITTTLSFSVSGTVESLTASEGQRVSKGQVLGKIDAGDYVNAKNIAYAQLAEAQDGYNRLKKLHDANALPEVKWVEMEQKLKQAQNAAEMADRTLNDAILRAPVSGTISRKFVEPGQTVIPVQPIYEIVSTDALEVDVPVSENEISSFTVGRKAVISFEDPAFPEVEGKVITKAVVADPLTRSYNVKVSLPQTKNLLPGMLATVVFDKESDSEITATPGIYLPAGTVLLNDDNRWFVWIANDSVAERRFVEVDQLVANGILVTNGLLKGDKVIVEGMQKVGTGTKVIPLYKN